MNVKIESVSVKQLNELYVIEKQCFDQEAFSQRELAYLLTDYNSIGLAAKIDGEIVGFAIARVDVQRNAPFGHILTVDVMPAYRRRGMAQKLLCEIETILRERGVKECRLEVREDNFAALSLYRKMGYEKVGILERYYGEVDGVYLKKILR